MKRLFLLFAVTLVAVSCDDDKPDGLVEVRDPNDVNGWYDVEYRMYVDGKSVFPVSTDPLDGRVEVFDAPRDMGVYFYPDSDLLKFPPIDHDTGKDYIAMWSIHPEGNEYRYTFDYNGSVSLYVSGNHSTGGELVMSGEILTKSPDEIENLDAADRFSSIMGDRNMYHDIAMTIDMCVPDPDVPDGTIIDEETGYGIHKIRLVISSRLEAKQE